MKGVAGMMWTSSSVRNERLEQQVEDMAITLLTYCAGSHAEGIFSAIQEEVVLITAGIQQGRNGHPLLREDIAQAVGEALERRLSP